MEVDGFEDERQLGEEGLRILLIEDNLGDIVLIEEMLSDARHTTFEISSAKSLGDAQDLLSSCKYDVILLDLGLPDSQGLETLAAASKWHLDTPVIVLTGMSAEELGMQAVRLGAQDYLVKGETNIKELERSIRYAIERGRSTQALRESEERYSSMFHKSHAVMMLVDAESLGIVDANEAACNFYGHSWDDLTSMKVFDINVLPKKELKREMRRAKMMGQQRFLFRHRLADDRVRDVEVFSAPLDLNGRRLLHMIVHDITEHLLEERIRRDAYAQIDSNIERFAILIDEIRNPAFVIMELANRKEDDISSRIAQQAEHIESMVQQLDEGWLESEKVRDLLRKSMLG